MEKINADCSGRIATLAANIQALYARCDKKEKCQDEIFARLRSVESSRDMLMGWVALASLVVGLLIDNIKGLLK